MSWTLWLGLSLAAPPRPVPPTEAGDAAEAPVTVTGVGLYFRGVGEAWDEPELGRVYRPNALTGGVGLVIPLHQYAQLDLEVAYERMSGQHIDRDSLEPIDKTATIEIAPISAVVEGRVPFGASSHVYAGVGPTATLFKEEHESFVANTEDGVETSITNGTKIGVEARAGVRLMTGLVSPSASSVPSSGGLQGVSVELGFGRRFQKEPSEDGGFDLAAWRVTIGLGLNF